MRNLIIRNRQEFEAAGDDLSEAIVFPIDGVSLEGKRVHDAAFLGWNLQPDTRMDLERQGAIFFPALLDTERPYSIYRAELYSSAELMTGFDGMGIDTALDTQIHAWYRLHGEHHAPPVEAIMQRMHDLLIDVALQTQVASLDLRHRPIVGFMGGHDESRTAPSYRHVVRLARMLTRKGYCVLTGGGPGVMEAANLGAFLAPHDDDAVIDEAIALMAEEPVFEDRTRWITTAQRVIRKFGGPAAESSPFGWRSDLSLPGNPGESLSVPTWLYGHEPPNVFGSHIAKLFSNSIREDGLVSIANGGIIYAEGSAGTVQEIFADAAQNYYMVNGASAMVLLGCRQWKERIPVWQTLAALAEKSAATGKNPRFPAMIECLDDVDAVFEFIDRHPHVENA